MIRKTYSTPKQTTYLAHLKQKKEKCLISTQQNFLFSKQQLASRVYDKYCDKGLAGGPGRSALIGLSQSWPSRRGDY